MVNEASNLPRGQTHFHAATSSGIPDAFRCLPAGHSNSTQTRPKACRRNDMHQQKVGLVLAGRFEGHVAADDQLRRALGLVSAPSPTPTDRLRNLSFRHGEAQHHQRQLSYPAGARSADVTEALYDINWKQIMPRLGIVYRLNERMVLRTGAGHFYIPQQTNNFNILGIEPAFLRLDRLPERPNQSHGDDRESVRRLPGWRRPCGARDAGQSSRRTATTGRCTSTTRSGSGPRRSNAVSARISSPASPTSAAQALNLDMPVQNWNNPDPGTGAVQDRAPYQFYVDSRDPNTLLPLGTVRRLESWTNSNYHALQVRAEKRYSHGLTFNASFNFQKAMYIGYGVNEGGPTATAITQDPRDRWPTTAGRTSTSVSVSSSPTSGRFRGCARARASKGWCSAAGQSTASSSSPRACR